MQLEFVLVEFSTLSLSRQRCNYKPIRMKNLQLRFEQELFALPPVPGQGAVHLRGLVIDRGRGARRGRETLRGGGAWGQRPLGRPGAGHGQRGGARDAA